MTTWSYSRLDSYNQCPYQFYLKYVEGLEGESNAWAEVGSFCHSILEGVAKGEIPHQAVSDYFVEHYPDVLFPDLSDKYDYGEKLRDELLDFFDHFEGFDNVVSVERHFTLDLDNGDKLQGFVDREFMHNGKVKCVDYKISAPFKKADLVKKKRQLYIYAESIFREYGEYPDEMEFYFLKARKKTIVPFKQEELKETFDWVYSTIEAINNEQSFEARPNFFVCQNLCDFRNICQMK